MQFQLMIRHRNCSLSSKMIFQYKLNSILISKFLTGVHSSENCCDILSAVKRNTLLQNVSHILVIGI